MTSKYGTGFKVNSIGSLENSESLNLWVKYYQGCFIITIPGHLTRFPDSHSLTYQVVVFPATADTRKSFTQQRALQIHQLPTPRKNLTTARDCLMTEGEVTSQQKQRG